jgi:hypothetical protein
MSPSKVIDVIGQEATIRLISTHTDSAFRAANLIDRVIIWKALADLSKRKYWTRIWIVQEITVAREVKLFCGDDTILWSAFATACKFPPDHLTPWASELWAVPTKEGIDVKATRRAAGRQLITARCMD